MSWIVTDSNGNEMRFASEGEMLEHYGKDTLEDCLACVAGYRDFGDMMERIPALQGMSREEAIGHLDDIWWLDGAIEKEE